MSTEKRPLYYTFGNHMHWVDMQWLWGYEVLPGCVADMLHLCRETGAKGCVNFDGIGYEKMAAECPEALADLREAVAAGTVEPVGCSYGQPYGLFQPGESNVRQFTYGVRSVRRLLGVRPRTFWEEEFYFFPQLPQVLASCGFTGANLFFQWTWHTPEIPKESASLVLWEGADGTRVPALPRNALNVHQWPEDFDGLLEQGLINELASPAIVQWLELMPSQDWMCRSEVLLPRLKELFSDDRFELRARTCVEMIAELSEAARRREGGTGGEALPVRKYRMDEVWHGMLLGKNADRHPRTSRFAEAEILAAESMAAVAGLFGRPYASWDVYPAWEIDEAWRELLSAQHHDNHECEGLCGFVGYHSMLRARALAGEVAERTRAHLEQRAGSPVLSNALGWSRTVEALVPVGEEGEYRGALVALAPFGFATEGAVVGEASETFITERGEVWTLRREGLEVEIDVERGLVVQIRSRSHPDGALHGDRPLLDLRQLVQGKRWQRPAVAAVDVSDTSIRLHFEPDVLREDETPRPGLEAEARAFWIEIGISADGRGVDVAFSGIDSLTRPDPGFGGALRMAIGPAREVAEIRADSAYAVEACGGSGRVSRKYPRGDWMTSPQWFEHVEGSIVAQSFIDLLDESGGGLLVAHNGCQQWFGADGGVDVILNAYCPWDEARYDPGAFNVPVIRLIPHGGLSDAERVRLAREFAESDGGQRPAILERAVGALPVGGGDRAEAAPAPVSFGGLEVTGAPGVLAHAFYRDSAKAGEHLPDWAGHRMARESSGACTHPYVIRLVEWNGEPAEVVLKLPGEVASAAKTNLMGECGAWDAGNAPGHAPGHLRDTGWLSVEPTTPPDWARGAKFRGREIPWIAVRFAVRPREIATVMADLVMGRKEFRDLDARREVWATVHRVEG